MKSTRRTFLRDAAILAGVAAFPSPGFLKAQNPNSKLNLACIGVGGMGDFSVTEVKGENIVALCDVDEARAAANFGRFPEAKKYTDFRKMFDEMDGKIDAVTVSTPDHTHAAISVAAMNRGIHCYTEKPLAHDIGEVRKMIEVSKAKKVQTQMGIQMHVNHNYRIAVELIQAGGIGKISEVHVWSSNGYGGRTIPSGDFNVPKTLDWDLWLGPVAERPYKPCYVPGKWRGFWAFGNGALGDMACHYMDLPFWALGLRHPTSIKASGPPVDAESCSNGLTVTYEFPKTDKHDALTMTWYDHTLRPELFKEFEQEDDWKGGVIFVGSEGKLLADYKRQRLAPWSKFKKYKRPESWLPVSPGHHAEWIEAIKNGGTTSCDFDYGGTLTETVLLGVLAYRAEKKLTWDPATMKTGVAEADALIHQSRRKGWELG